MINLKKNKILIFTNNWISFCKKKLRTQESYDKFTIFTFLDGRVGEPSTKKDLQTGSLFKIRVETLPSKTIKYRFTRGCYARRKVTTNLQFSRFRTVGWENPPQKKTSKQEVFLKYAWRDSNPRPFGSQPNALSSWATRAYSIFCVSLAGQSLFSILLNFLF